MELNHNQFMKKALQEAKYAFFKGEVPIANLFIKIQLNLNLYRSIIIHLTNQ